MTLLKKHTPSLTALQTFVCAAKAASFSQAAVQLHLTQSAVSRQIKELENQLGVSLFERIRQRVTLTSIGQAFLADAEQILEATESAVLNAMASANSQHSLNIATLPTFASYWLLPRLPSFVERYPNIALNFVSRTEPFDFASDPQDLAIHFGQPSWPEAQCQLICREQIVPVASHEYAKRLGLDQQLEKIAGATLLHIGTRASSWRQWFDARQLDIGQTRHLRFDQFSLIISAAIAGLGVALLPSYFIQSQLAAGQLRTLGPGLNTTDNYYLVVPNAKRELHATRCFSQWLGEQTGFNANS